MALSSIGRTKGSQPLKTDSTPVGATNLKGPVTQLVRVPDSIRIGSPKRASLVSSIGRTGGIAGSKTSSILVTKPNQVVAGSSPARPTSSLKLIFFCTKGT